MKGGASCRVLKVYIFLIKGKTPTILAAIVTYEAEPCRLGKNNYILALLFYFTFGLSVWSTE